MVYRKEQGEGASAGWITLQFNGTAQQFSKTPADRESQTGSSILTAGRNFRLLEGFKNDVLFFLRNTNTGIADCKCDHLFCSVKIRVACFPVFIGLVYAQFY